MSNEKSIPPTDRPEPAHRLPRHPFFEFTANQANFSQCLDAIDRVDAVIELCNCLKLDGDIEGGLTPKAAYGYYWVTLLMRGALSYVSDRLIVLKRQQQETDRTKSACLSALLTALPALDEANSERFLDSAALQMGMTRSSLDQFIHKIRRSGVS
jgi:hypothetical protein